MIVLRINSYMEKVMSKTLNFKFIKTYRPFMFISERQRLRSAALLRGLIGP